MTYHDLQHLQKEIRTKRRVEAVAGKKLSQYLHQAETDRRSAVLLLGVYCRAGARSHLTVLADFLSSLSSPAAPVLS